jgi:hypothetical protein
MVHQLALNLYRASSLYPEADLYNGMDAEFELRSLGLKLRVADLFAV